MRNRLLGRLYGTNAQHPHVANLLRYAPQTADVESWTAIFY